MARNERNPHPLAVTPVAVAVPIQISELCTIHASNVSVLAVRQLGIWRDCRENVNACSFPMLHATPAWHVCMPCFAIPALLAALTWATYLCHPGRRRLGGLIHRANVWHAGGLVRRLPATQRFDFHAVHPVCLLTDPIAVATKLAPPALLGCAVQPAVRARSGGADRPLLSLPPSLCVLIGLVHVCRTECCWIGF